MTNYWFKFFTIIWISTTLLSGGLIAGEVAEPGEVDEETMGILALDANDLSTFLYASPTDFNQRACGGTLSNAELEQLFGSITAFNCNEFRTRGDDAKYCKCIETILRPNPENGFEDSVFQEIIEDAYLDLIIQKINDDEIAGLEAFVPIEFMYNSWLENPNATTTCFSEEMAILRDPENVASQDIKLERDDYYHEILITAEREFGISPIGIASARPQTRSNDQQALKQLFLQMLPSIRSAFEQQILDELNPDATRETEHTFSDYSPEVVSEMTTKVSSGIIYRGAADINTLLASSYRNSLAGVTQFDTSSFSDIKSVFENSNPGTRLSRDLTRPLTVALMEIGRQNGMFDSLEAAKAFNPNNVEGINFDISSLDEVFMATGLTGNCGTHVGQLYNNTFMRENYLANDSARLREMLKSELASNNMLRADLLIQNLEAQIDLPSFRDEFERRQPDMTRQYTPAERAQRIDQAWLNMQFKFGQMRCHVPRNRDGATIAEIEEQLKSQLANTELSPEEFLSKVEKLADDIAQNEFENHTNINYIDQAKEVLSGNKMLLLEKLKDIYPGNPGPYDNKQDLSYDELMAILNDHARTHCDGFEELLETTLDNYGVIISLQEDIAFNQRESLELRHNLSTLLGGERYANGLISQKLAPWYNTRSALVRENLEGGITAADTRFAVIAAQSALAAGTLSPTAIVIPEVIKVPELRPDNIVMPNTQTILEIIAAEKALDVEAVAAGLTVARTEDEKHEIAHVAPEVKEIREYIENREYQQIVEAVETGLDVPKFQLSRVENSRRDKSFNDLDRVPGQRKEMLTQIATSRQDLKTSIKENRTAEGREKRVRNMSDDELKSETARVAERAPLTETTLSPRKNRVQRRTVETPVDRAPTSDFAAQRNQIIQDDATLRTNARNYRQSREQFQPNPVADDQLSTIISEFKKTIVDQNEFIQETRTAIAEERALAAKVEAETEEILAAKANEAAAPESFPAVVNEDEGPFSASLVSAPVTRGSERKDNANDLARARAAATSTAAVRAPSVAPEGPKYEEGRTVNRDPAGESAAEVSPLPRRLTDDELATAKVQGLEIGATQPIDTVLSLTNTGNELSSSAFIQLHDSRIVPENMDLTKPIIVRTNSGHLIVEPVIQDGKIVSFRYVSEVPARTVEQHIVLEEIDLQSRSIRYATLKSLLDHR